jgi:uncharacterized protein (TIGR01244 family)
MGAGFRRVDDGFWVSPQIDVEDIAAARAEGVRVIINNRPDEEAPGLGDTLKAAAEAAGLTYVASPVRGGPAQANVDEMNAALAQGPALAFCTSGTRSILTWAIAQLISGARSREDVLALARNAGFELSRWI